MRTERIIGNRRCYIYENSLASDIVIQAIGEHELESLDREVEKSKELAQDHPFILIAFLISDWNKELPPWEAPAVFGKDDFGAGASATLTYIMEELLPEIEKSYPTDDEKRYFLGGYSLAGLFALWAAYQTESFQGIAAVSPSVWFPKWDCFILENQIHTPKVYLSLGDKEEKAKNKVMATVGNNIRRQYARMREESAVNQCKLEWNQGNHFVDSEIRMAKGIAWLLES